MLNDRNWSSIGNVICDEVSEGNGWAKRAQAHNGRRRSVRSAHTARGAEKCEALKSEKRGHDITFYHPGRQTYITYGAEHRLLALIARKSG